MLVMVRMKTIADLKLKIPVQIYSYFVYLVTGNITTEFCINSLCLDRLAQVYSFSLDRISKTRSSIRCIGVICSGRPIRRFHNMEPTAIGNTVRKQRMLQSNRDTTQVSDATYIRRRKKNRLEQV